MATVRFMTLLFVEYLLFLSVARICSQTNLNQVFQNNCHRPNCTLSLHESEYLLNAPIQVSNWTHFKIIAPNHTTIRCVQMKKERGVIDISHTEYVVLDGISFVNCSRPKIFNNSYRIHEVHHFENITKFQFCYSVVINNCYFPDFSQFAVVLRNTSIVRLTNSYFKASPGTLYARAVTYELSDRRNVSLHVYNTTVDGCNMKYTDRFHYEHLFFGSAMVIFINKAEHVIIRINDSKFLNSNSMQGGAILIEILKSLKIYEIDISGCHFENNTALEKVSKGGALTVRAFSHEGYARIKNCSFVKNRAYNGGALAVLLHERDVTFEVSISDSSFKNNIAKYHAGGAIYAENIYMTNNNSIPIKNTNFEKNEANSGGAILGFNFWVLLEDNVTIRENTAYYGGGVCLLGGGMTFRGSDIVLERNYAKHSGGALYLHSSAWLYPNGTHTLVENNTANLRGGAMFVYSRYYQDSNSNNWNFWQRNIANEPSCFLQRGKMRDSLIFKNNNAHNFGQLCMGYDIYTSGWASCYSGDKPSIFHNSITFEDRRKNNCSITLDIHRYSSKIDLKSPCEVQINYTSLINPVFNCDNKSFKIENLHRFKKRVIDTINIHASYIRKNQIKSVHLFFPGYLSNISIQSFDNLGNPVETLTTIVFKSVNSRNFKMEQFGVSKSGTFKPFKIKNVDEENFVFGKICLESNVTLNKVVFCNYVIIANCTNPLSCSNTTSLALFGRNVTIKDSSIRVPPGTLLSYTTTVDKGYVFTRCTWSQCTCRTYLKQDCKIHLNALGEQCLEGLTLPFCSRCTQKDHRPSPQFSLFNRILNKTTNCFKCTQPYLMILIYVIITLVITVLICALGIDVFSDYTRSITFYSSTIYLLGVSGQMFEYQPIYRILSVPIVIMNLLVANIFPFCLPVDELLSMAIFEMVAPFLFILYIVIMIICVKYIPYFSNFGKYDLVNKFWTIIVLIYAHVCNQAFQILDCSGDSNEVLRWFFDAKEQCLLGQHLAASITAISVLFILFYFPFLMFSFSRSNNPEYRSFVRIYEERYRVGYKQWEMLKLYLRVLFSLIFSLLPIIHSVVFLRSVVSIICLLLLVLNSLLRPATNWKANQFESICLAILAFSSFQVERKYKILLVFPYIIYIIYLLTLAGENARGLIRWGVKATKRFCM